MEKISDLENKKELSEKYSGIIDQLGLKQLYRKIDSKTFVSRYEFYSYLRYLYIDKKGQYCVVFKYDPAPGGFGEEFMFIENMTVLFNVENADTLSLDEILETVSENAEKWQFEKQIIDEYKGPYFGFDLGYGDRLENYDIRKMDNGDYDIFVQAGSRVAGYSNIWTIKKEDIENSSFEEVIAQFPLSKKIWDLLVNDEKLRSFLGF